MEHFGTLNGRAVQLIRLERPGMACEIITFGAAVRSLIVPDRDGVPRDLVLGFDTPEEYLRHTCYFGAVIGPVANRIAGAAFSLNGVTHTMDPNDGVNCNHSGLAGLNARIWDVESVSREAVTLSCVHPDGLGGIPGDLRIWVTYTLNGRGLAIEYRAVSDRDTLCSLTNHSYFNLEGHDSGSVADHRIEIFARSFTPTDAASIPTGAIRAVAGTPMDLTRPTRIGDFIDGSYDQLRNAGGYDHNWVIDPGEEAFRPAARVSAPGTGIRMTVYTDRPGLQFYTGNYIPDGLPGKDGAVYNRRQGLCLETQAFPDAPHHSSFPPITLQAGRTWQSRTAYIVEVTGDR